MLHAAFALEAHLHLASVVVDLAAQHGGRAVALVRFRIFLTADAQIFVVEQANDRCHDLVLADGTLLQVLVDLAPDLWERLAELDQPFELGALSHLPEQWMVAILLAPPPIDPGTLQMPFAIGAAPGAFVT